MNGRQSGILLHITSLPGGFGIGDLGPEAYRFADFLAEAGQKLWQVLPLNPVDPISGYSPYSSASVFGGNPLLISPERLAQVGLLDAAEVDAARMAPGARCDYPAATACREKLLARACAAFVRGATDRSAFEGFCARQAYWLDDYALFAAIKQHQRGAPWYAWPPELRDRDSAALASVRTAQAAVIDAVRFLQYQFYRQWCELKHYCNDRGVALIGDLPIYVNYDSADVWSHQQLFNLGDDRQLLSVAGVPPDYFSKTGQRWGNPVYRWDVLQQTGFQWWISRFRQSRELYDVVRVDHFRGLVAYWDVPAAEKTAVNGRWVPVPAEAFFSAVLEACPGIDIIAEDLGTITDDVRGMMQRFGFPGMRLLLFAFGDDDPLHPYLPHTFVPGCVVYTGTHDNNTARGWFEQEAGPAERRRVARYAGRRCTAANIAAVLTRLAMMSVADRVVIPLQDVLGLDGSARMNLPGTPRGNWAWRLLAGQATPHTAGALAELTRICGR